MPIERNIGGYENRTLASMKHAAAEQIRNIVSGAISRSRHSDLFTGADVDSSDYNDDGNFIRIVVHFRNLDDLSEDDVDAITSSIESAITSQDDRFPSIRFSEP